MGLLRLPDELLDSIMEEHGDSERDLNAICQTSRRLYGLVNARLYRHNVEVNGSWALCWAAERGFLGTAQHMLREGANVNSEHPRFGDSSPLILTIDRCHEEVAESLLAQDDVNLEDIRIGRTVLGHAVCSGLDSIVRLLLAMDVNVNACDRQERTPLALATVKDHSTIMDCYLREMR